MHAHSSAPHVELCTATTGSVRVIEAHTQPHQQHDATHSRLTTSRCPVCAALCSAVARPERVNASTTAPAGGNVTWRTTTMLRAKGCCLTQSQSHLALAEIPQCRVQAATANARVHCCSWCFFYAWAALHRIAVSVGYSPECTHPQQLIPQQTTFAHGRACMLHSAAATSMRAGLLPSACWCIAV